MNNQWKMVPVEPTAGMEDAGCQAYMDAEGMIGIMHKSSMGHAFQAMLAAAPVPPAGSRLDANELSALRICAKLGHSTTPEVLLRLLGMVNPVPPTGDVEVRDAFCAAYRELHGYAPLRVEGTNGYKVFTAGFDSRTAHVTRLTAERDGLLADLDAWKATAETFEDFYRKTEAERDALQSELTKARELNPINWTDRQVLDFLGVALRNVDLAGEVRLSEIRQGFQFMQEHQSAPAVKGGKCWSCKQLVTVAQWQEADGNCPRCDVEIEDAEGLKP